MSIDSNLGEHVPFYQCECGKTFAGQDAMRAHTQECEAMPHIGNDGDA